MSAEAPARRVIVNLHAAQRELALDLAAVGPRQRAERLRSLALIGLAALRGGAGAPSPTRSAPLPETPPPPDAQLQRRLRLLDSVAAGE